MNLDYCIKQMSDNPETIRQLIHDIPDDAARWKPDADTWSIIQVMAHLVYEERRDFRVRLDHILNHGQEKFKPITNEIGDPEGDLQTLFTIYLDEREASIKWLKTLTDVDWSTEFTTPYRTMSAGDMLASWVAHDILHIRQFVELKWAITTHALQPYEVGYAGGW